MSSLIRLRRNQCCPRLPVIGRLGGPEETTKGNEEPQHISTGTRRLFDSVDVRQVGVGHTGGGLSRPPREVAGNWLQGTTAGTSRKPGETISQDQSGRSRETDTSCGGFRN